MEDKYIDFVNETICPECGYSNKMHFFIERDDVEKAEEEFRQEKGVDEPINYADLFDLDMYKDSTKTCVWCKAKIKVNYRSIKRCDLSEKMSSAYEQARSRAIELNEEYAELEEKWKGILD